MNDTGKVKIRIELVEVDGHEAIQGQFDPPVSIEQNRLLIAGFEDALRRMQALQDAGERDVLATYDQPAGAA